MKKKSARKIPGNLSRGAPLIDCRKVVKQGLNAIDSGIGSVAIDQLPGKRLGDPSVSSDPLPIGGTGALEAVDEGIEYFAHGRIVFPFAGTCQPAYGTDQRGHYKAMNARDTLAKNLLRLMHSAGLSSLGLEKETKAKGLKVGKSTIDRATKSETTLNLDYIEVIAKVFNVQPSQLLAHDAAGQLSLAPEEEEIINAFRDIEDPVQRSKLMNDIMATAYRSSRKGDKMTTRDRQAIQNPAYKGPDRRSDRRHFDESGEVSETKPIRKGGSSEGTV